MCLSDTQDRTHTPHLAFLCSSASVESERRWQRRRVNSSPSVGLLRVRTYTHPSLRPPPMSALHLSHPTQVRLRGGDPSCGFYGANPCGSLKARYSGEGRFLQPARPAPLSAGFSTVEVTLIATFMAHGCHGRQHSRPADCRFYGLKCVCVCVPRCLLRRLLPRKSVCLAGLERCSVC